MTRTRWFLLTTLMAVTVVCVTAGPASAAELMEPANAAEVVAAPSSLNAVVNNIRNWLVGLLVALATLMLTIGGLIYLTAGGEVRQIERAKSALKSAAFGYLLAAVAPLLTDVLKNIAGV